MGVHHPAGSGQGRSSQQPGCLRVPVSSVFAERRQSHHVLVRSLGPLILFYLRKNKKSFSALSRSSVGCDTRSMSSLHSCSLNLRGKPTVLGAVEVGGVRWAGPRGGARWEVWPRGGVRWAGPWGWGAVGGAGPWGRGRLPSGSFSAFPPAGPCPTGRSREAGLLSQPRLSGRFWFPAGKAASFFPSGDRKSQHRCSPLHGKVTFSFLFRMLRTIFPSYGKSNLYWLLKNGKYRRNV